MEEELNFCLETNLVYLFLIGEARSLHSLFVCMSNMCSKVSTHMWVSNNTSRIY